MMEKNIYRKGLTVGVSICAVVLLVLGSLTNVVGIENVNSCNCSDPPCWPELSGTMGDNNWYVSSVKVTFNGTTNNTYYRINGSNWIKYTEPFELIPQGINLLEWTCDSNTSNISSLEIKIDLDYPILSNYTVKWVGLLKWQFGITATDNISGVNRVEFSLGNLVDTEPPYQFIWRGCWWLFCLIDLFDIYFLQWDAWDNAGNEIPQISYNKCSN